MSPKGLKSGYHQSYCDCMKITMNDENIVSITQLRSFLKEVVNVSFNINNKAYIDNKLITPDSCFISLVSIELSSIINFILLSEILIISTNINISDLLLCSFNNKNINITLIVFNQFYISGFILLKNKYPNINIYIVGNNIDYTFYDTIKNICSNKKFDSIIIDNGISSMKYITCLLYTSDAADE